jgi:phospholipid N-methyltransferase
MPENRAPWSRHLYSAWGKVRTISAFLKEFAHSPLHVGSICPSSRFLTSALVDIMDDAAGALHSHDCPGLIIDLGAGSGIVSETLLRMGVSPERIVAVEISPGFAQVFQRRCPGVRLLIGDARHLGALLDEYAPATPVTGIISSLPLRVFPAWLIGEILQEIKNVMSQRGGSLIQYTYAWWMRYPLSQYGFMPYASRSVLRNLPPAKVESYLAPPPAG